MRWYKIRLKKILQWTSSGLDLIFRIVCSILCKRKKVRIVLNFLRHFLTTFWQLQTAFLIFKITAFLFGCSIRRNAIFSSSGAVSSKLDAEVPKVTEKDALCFLKTFFVSFVLKYADKENSWQSPCAMTFLLFFCFCLRSHKTLSKQHCCL